jgi:hypothetical protein
MSRSTVPVLATVLALAGVIPRGSAAQTTPAGKATALVVAVGRAPAPAALKSAYRVRLTSTWPQEIEASGCRNGGTETLVGELTAQADGSYTGTLHRRTELLFCGMHGTPQVMEAAGCAVTLAGEGTVAARGVIVADDSTPSGRGMRLTWTPALGHEAVVSGACAPGFKRALKAMYLVTAHAAEFPLTTVGAGPRSERLENYAWEVELE